MQMRRHARRLRGLPPRLPAAGAAATTHLPLGLLVLPQILLDVLEAEGPHCNLCLLLLGELAPAAGGTALDLCADVVSLHAWRPDARACGQHSGRSRRARRARSGHVRHARHARLAIAVDVESGDELQALDELVHRRLDMIRQIAERVAADALALLLQDDRGHGAASKRGASTMGGVVCPHHPPRHPPDPSIRYVYVCT